MRAKESPCPACVGTDANHLILWLNGASDVLMLRAPTERFPFYVPLMRVADVILSALERLSFVVSRSLGVITLTDDPATAVSDRSRLLWEEARRRSLPIEQLLLFKRPLDTFRLQSNGRTYFFTSLPLQVESSALRMDDKVFFKKMLTEAGLPVPKSYSVSNLADAKKALAGLSVVCVKPQTGSNGRHTYPHVRTEDELAEALKSVKQICPFASVEEHLEGNLCRATCVDGKLVGFLESEHPHVTGDGISTIRQLIAKANETKRAGTEDFTLNGYFEGYIRRRGFELDSVLPAGVRLQLSYRGGRSVASTSREYGRTIHPSFIPVIERAAGVTRLPVVGFDIIIPDPLKPADEQRWGFIEANSLPWIDLHAKPYFGDPIDLSVAVWDMWEAQQVFSDTDRP